MQVYIIKKYNLYSTDAISCCICIGKSNLSDYELQIVLRPFFFIYLRILVQKLRLTYVEGSYETT